MYKIVFEYAEQDIAEYEITEVCPHCESEITMQWNVSESGYKAYCPVCGKRLMLCSACHDDTEVCVTTTAKPILANLIHAKWIHDGQRVKGGVDWYHCSNCLAPESGVYVHRPYCSWCGAKIDEK